MKRLIKVSNLESDKTIRDRRDKRQHDNSDTNDVVYNIKALGV